MACVVRKRPSMTILILPLCICQHLKCALMFGNVCTCRRHALKPSYSIQAESKILTVDRRNGAPEVHVFPTSPVFIPETSVVRRLPRHPERQRPSHFFEAFEDRALFYDCFYSGDTDIILVGPPPLNLEPLLKSAIFRALPTGKRLEPSWFASRSTMTTVLNGAPPGTNAVEIEVEGITEIIPVQPYCPEIFANRRVMFTMNKDNDLAWMDLWARWHSQLHGVDAIVIFDNGSTRYGLKEIADTLSRVDGLKTIGLVSMPFRYGPVDRAVLSHPYWPNFLQVASFAMMTRRFACQSAGILNCDIDELIGRSGDGDVFAMLDASRDGFVRLKGTWIETAQGAPKDSSKILPAHLGFEYRRKNPLLVRCANKWALDPRRSWTQDFSTVPMMHRIYGMPRARTLMAPSLPFWHFRGINTNWKEDRVRRERPFADPDRHAKDKAWLKTRKVFIESKAFVGAI